MTEGNTARLVAWGRELRAVHERLREALSVTQVALADGRAADVATRDLLLFCHGFCAALTGHHKGEDRALFPAVGAAHPELAATLYYLRQDHSMIAHLLEGLRAASTETASPAELGRHLDGIAAIMESHFRYEERTLLAVLDTLTLDATPEDVLGPL